MRRIGLVVCMTASLLCTWRGSFADEPPPRVLLIIVDGLRADSVTAQWTPYLSFLMRRGAYALDAQATMPSVTIANITSMLTGQAPGVHGLGNVPLIDTPLVTTTILELAHDAGLTTALYLGKPKLGYLAKPGTCDLLEVGTPPHSNQLLDRFVNDLQHTPQPWSLAVFHVLEPDTYGHRYGWGSPQYLYGVRVADAHVGVILHALETKQLLDDTLIIVTADHGGIDLNHNRPHPDTLHVPWIASGPGVPHGHSLTDPIKPYDTAPTILAALGLPIPEDMDGSVIDEVVPTSVHSR